MIQKKARTHTKQSFIYFWMVFTTNIAMYAFVTHAVIKHPEWPVIAAALTAVAVYTPFMFVLMKKFKAMAILKDTSITSHIQKQYDLLESFYRFKKRYDIMLLPVGAFVGTFLAFELWNPGGIAASPYVAGVGFVLSLIACMVAQRKENKKSFDIPLSKLRLILEDLKA